MSLFVQRHDYLQLYEKMSPNLLGRTMSSGTKWSETADLNCDYTPPQTECHNQVRRVSDWNRISIMPFVTKVSCTLGGHIHSGGGTRPLCRIGTSHASLVSLGETFLANCRRNTPRIAPRKGIRPIRLGTFDRKSSKPSDWDRCLAYGTSGLPKAFDWLCSPTIPFIYTSKCRQLPSCEGYHLHSIPWTPRWLPRWTLSLHFG